MLQKTFAKIVAGFLIMTSNSSVTMKTYHQSGCRQLYPDKVFFSCVVKYIFVVVYTLLDL